MAQLSQLTALEQAEAIASGQCSAVELTRHYLDRTERFGDAVGAFITVTPELALEQARAVDARVAAGERGPLLGCVAPVKDLDLVADVPCTFGSRAFADVVPPVDSDFVTRMRAAGLVITGKTNTPEFGFPCYTENDLAAPARTPWDLTRSAGGSSGGAAAAVAARLASVAQGSDGGGSIRIPASVTGLVGIKPARGRVGVGPNVDGVGELVSVGPLARTVADAAALLDVLAGSRPGDPFAQPAAPGSFLAAARREPGRLRIGRFATPLIARVDVHPDCLAAYEHASAVLADLGHDVEDIRAPFTRGVIDVFEVIWTTAAAAIPVSAQQEPMLLPMTRWLRERGATLSAADLANAVTAARLAARNAVDATAGYDVLLTPTLAQPPAPVGGLRDDGDPAKDFAAQIAFTPFTSPFNVSGQPAMNLPLHVSGAGLPIGVHLVGRPRDEWTVISLAAQVEQVIGWQHRLPELGAVA